MVSNYRLKDYNYTLRGINYRLIVSNYRLKDYNYKLRGINYRLIVSNYRLLKVMLIEILGNPQNPLIQNC